MKRGKADDRGPWHIVNRITGKHHGPFTTEFDCAMARSIATPDWATGIDMDRETFNRHIDRLVAEDKEREQAERNKP